MCDKAYNYWLFIISSVLVYEENYEGSYAEFARVASCVRIVSLFCAYVDIFYVCVFLLCCFILVFTQGSP